MPNFDVRTVAVPARRSRKPGILFCMLSGFLALCIAAPAAAAEGELRAGAATSNITPPLGELVVGGWKPFPARHIHDELHARCLVLEAGGTHLVIVLCDNVGIPREVYENAKGRLEEILEIPASHMLMAATHTHSATTARTDNRLIRATKLTGYQQFLADRIVDGVRRAANQLEPAQIGWGVVDVPDEVFNRRWHMTDKSQMSNPFGGVDQVRMNPPRAHASLLRPAGPTDPQVSFLSVQSRDGRPICLLANYSLHYVGGVGSGHVSADYFGVFADRIQQLLGADRLDPPFVGIMSNGTSGDINNINFAAKAERYGPYEKMREVAFKVADAVYHAHQSLEFHNNVALGAVTRVLTLKVRKPTADQWERAQKLLDDPDAPTEHVRERIYAERLKRQMESPDEVQIPLQALRIGDLGITAIPFEVFVEIGLELKEKSPFERTFTIELANGSFGYLPTPEQHKLGGYETWLGSNVVETSASDKMIEQLIPMLNELK